MRLFLMLIYSRPAQKLEPHRRLIPGSTETISLYCSYCNSLRGREDTFCPDCGNALTLPGASDQIPIHYPETRASGSQAISWGGFQVMLGIFLVALAITPTIFLALFLSDFLDRHHLAVQAWTASVVMGLVILVVVWRLAPGQLSALPMSLGMVKPRGRWWISMLLAVGGLVASLVITGLYSALVIWLDVDLLTPPEIGSQIAFPGLAALITFAGLAVWTPVTEEIFFRGFIFAGLVSRFGPWWSMIASAVIFSAFHLNWGVVIPIFVTGLILAWLYHRTGSLWPGIAAHAGQNSLALLGATYGV